MNKNKLITALRASANALERNTFSYNWKEPNRCNCGILACAILGVSADELVSMLPRASNALWQTRIGEHCPVTGIPNNEMFKALFEAGLSAEDMVNLEALADKRVLNILDAKTMQHFWVPTKQVPWYQFWKKKEGAWYIDYKNKKNLIRYMRAWADLLQEEGADDVATEPHPAQQNVA